MPVGLMFDVNITGGEEWLNSLNLTNLCRFYDVSLTTRPTKSREFWKTVALRTTERNISSMYIVCRRIRDLLLDNAIDNSIYASKSLNSESYQLNSDKLWPNDIFKSNNQYKEVERFSNSSPEDVFQQDDESSTIKTTASENTTSCKSSTHEKDGLRLMSYESSAEWQLKSDSIVTDNNRIWKGYDDFNRSLNIQTNEIYTKMDDKPSTQTRSILTNRNIQNNSYNIPGRMLKSFNYE
nr:unnamed protein product [Trichobilharzia regenti]